MIRIAIINNNNNNNNNLFVLSAYINIKLQDRKCILHGRISTHLFLDVLHPATAALWECLADISRILCKYINRRDMFNAVITICRQDADTAHQPILSYY